MPQPGTGSTLSAFGWMAWPRTHPAYRPVNVAALIGMQGAAPCPPMQVAPGVWIAPWCKPLPDFRSALWQRPVGLQASNLPPSVELRAMGLDGPVKNQAMVSVCWAFSVSSVMENALLRSGIHEEISPQHAVARDALEQLQADGESAPLTVEADWIYDPAKACKLHDDDPGCEQAYSVHSGSWRDDPQLVAEKRGADAHGRWAVVGIDKLDVGNHAELPATIMDLVAKGEALYTALGIDSQAWSGAIPGGVLPEYTSETRGSHAVTLVGYRTGAGGRQFLLKNSWGTEWGQGGYAWISEPQLLAHVSRIYRLRVAQRAPAMAACPAGQTHDRVLGLCAPACADGSAPSAGMCQGGGLPIPAGLPSPAGWPSAPPNPAHWGSAPGGWPVPLPSGLPPLPSSLPPGR